MPALPVRLRPLTLVASVGCLLLLTPGPFPAEDSSVSPVRIENPNLYTTIGLVEAQSQAPESSSTPIASTSDGERQSVEQPIDLPTPSAGFEPAVRYLLRTAQK